MSSKRIGILFGGVAVVFCALLARLFQLQMLRDESLRPLGISDERLVELPAARGAILDRDSRPLRVTRDAFDVHVTASAFRERNVVDALADLTVLLSPEPRHAAPLDRGRLVLELRGRHPGSAIAAVLALDARAAIAEEADDLHGRARVLIEPEGTLVRPSSFARRRVLDALAVLGGEQGPTRRDIRKRLRADQGSVGEITEATVRGLEERIRDEEEGLARLGLDLELGDAGAVRAAIDDLCDLHYRRVEAEVERRVDDAICLQQFGSWSLDVSKLGDEEAVSLRSRAAAAIADATRARAAVSAGRSILSGRLPGPIGAPEAQPVTDVDLARAAGLADWDPAAVRKALCGRIRSAPGFDRSRYMDARKEGQTRNELSAFRGDELGCGGSTALAGIIEGPRGLRALGFELVPSFARDASRRQGGGSLALLLGDVTRRNHPSAPGVEQRLDDVLRGEPGEARIAEDGRVAALKPAQHGKNVRLTISLPLQQRIEPMLDRMGAVAIVDVATGGVLAATTCPLPPDGDPLSAIAELQCLKEKKKDLLERRAGGDASAEPLLASVRDRIIRSPAIHRSVTFEGNTPPGSVLKALTLLAGLEAGVITPAFEIDCTNNKGDRAHFGCHAHRRIDLEGAIERSCNEYCYQTVGLLGGSEPLFAMYEKVGLFDEVPGLIGSGPGAYVRNAIRGDDPRNLAIGQGSLSLPAVRLAGIAASLASGKTVRAHLYAPEGFVTVGAPLAQEHNLAIIRSGMWRVSVGDHGTAAKLSRNLLEPLGIAGKTGTAELEGDLNSAWFVGFAPYGAPRYAFAVLVDRTPDEGADAAPIAARVVEACYEVLGGRP